MERRLCLKRGRVLLGNARLFISKPLLPTNVQTGVIECKNDIISAASISLKSTQPPPLPVPPHPEGKRASAVIAKSKVTSHHRDVLFLPPVGRNNSAAHNLYEPLNMHSHSTPY